MGRKDKLSKKDERKSSRRSSSSRRESVDSKTHRGMSSSSADDVKTKHSISSSRTSNSSSSYLHPDKNRKDWVVSNSGSSDIESSAVEPILNPLVSYVSSPEEGELSDSSDDFEPKGPVATVVDNKTLISNKQHLPTFSKASVIDNKPLFSSKHYDTKCSKASIADNKPFFSNNRHDAKASVLDKESLHFSRQRDNFSKISVVDKKFLLTSKQCDNKFSKTAVVDSEPLFSSKQHSPKFSKSPIVDNKLFFTSKRDKFSKSPVVDNKLFFSSKQHDSKFSKPSVVDKEFLLPSKQHDSKCSKTAAVDNESLIYSKRKESTFSKASRVDNEPLCTSKQYDHKISKMNIVNNEFLLSSKQYNPNVSKTGKVDVENKKHLLSSSQQEPKFSKASIVDNEPLLTSKRYDHKISKTDVIDNKVLLSPKQRQPKFSKTATVDKPLISFKLRDPKFSKLAVIEKPSFSSKQRNAKLPKAAVVDNEPFSKQHEPKYSKAAEVDNESLLSSKQCDPKFFKVAGSYNNSLLSFKQCDSIKISKAAAVEKKLLVSPKHSDPKFSKAADVDNESLISSKQCDPKFSKAAGNELLSSKHCDYKIEGLDTKPLISFKERDSKFSKVASLENQRLLSSKHCDSKFSKETVVNDETSFNQCDSKYSKASVLDKPLFSPKKHDPVCSKSTIVDNKLLLPKRYDSKVSEEAPEDGVLSPKHCDDDVEKMDVAEQDLPPPIMQSTNLPTEDGLDVRHDGGGFETSNDDSCPKQPPVKRMKKESHTTKSSSKSGCPVATNHFVPVSDHTYSKVEKVESVPELKNEEEIDESMELDINDPSRVLEFDILDEFECEDDSDRDSETDSDTDISLDELDAMLDAGFENGKGPEREGTQGFEHVEKKKVILKVRGRDHFDVLPEGWIEVTHNSGMPVYLHKATRVCCVSKPYFLGPGSTRKHEIPVSAIPCLHYLKELEKERSRGTSSEKNKDDIGSFPAAKLESVKDTKESGSLDYLSVREYCKKRFEFQTITIKRFKTWSGRREHQKKLKQKERPSLPDSTKLITCPLPPVCDKAIANGNNTKREFIMNPSGKSPVCILHEYVQHTLKLQPRYIFKELENASTPYGAVVLIEDIEYGSGYGSSKKQAKAEAAKAVLDVLIPKMKMFPPECEWEDYQDVEFFDQVRVEDPRVCELSVKAGQPYPYQILLECLRRNFGMGDTETSFRMRNLKHQKNEFIMSVGKHTASVVCKNKRDGKHRASQAILQMLHPYISSWGSLLRLYGKGSIKTLKEKKEEEQRITELQSQACANKPNVSILNKLKEEMMKYRERMKSKKPIGKLIPEQMNLSTSDSNLKNVEL